VPHQRQAGDRADSREERHAALLRRARGAGIVATLSVEKGYASLGVARGHRQRRGRDRARERNAEKLA
jgi:hypothetical protein